VVKNVYLINIAAVANASVPLASHSVLIPVSISPLTQIIAELAAINAVQATFVTALARYTATRKKLIAPINASIYSLTIITVESAIINALLVAHVAMEHVFVHPVKPIVLRFASICKPMP
jgi:hypothetical protein